MPVVLLHGCWPYVREGAYLASVYGNAHLDLSYAIPFLSAGEMRAMTRAALGVAPIDQAHVQLRRCAACPSCTGWGRTPDGR